MNRRCALLARAGRRAKPDPTACPYRSLGKTGEKVSASDWVGIIPATRPMRMLDLALQQERTCVANGVSAFALKLSTPVAIAVVNV